MIPIILSILEAKINVFQLLIKKVYVYKLLLLLKMYSNMEIVDGLKCNLTMNLFLKGNLWRDLLLVSIELIIFVAVLSIVSVLLIQKQKEDSLSDYKKIFKHNKIKELEI